MIGGSLLRVRSVAGIEVRNDGDQNVGVAPDGQSDENHCIGLVLED